MKWPEASLYSIFWICIAIIVTTCTVYESKADPTYNYTSPNTDILHPDTREYYHPYPDNIDTRWWDKGIIDRYQQLYEIDPLNVEIYDED